VASNIPDLLIRGGTMIDDSNAPARRADLRLRDGPITEIGDDLRPREREETLDASGCYVPPGVSESHTRCDGTIGWQQRLDPLPGYGVTTLVMGNCDFALAAHFGSTDRGTIAVGRRADGTVSNLDESEHHPKHEGRDVPDGQGGTTRRWSRAPAPVRLTLASGVPTFDDGKSTRAGPETRMGRSHPPAG